MQNLDQHPTILQKIILDKIEWIKAKKTAFPLEQFQHEITKSERSFYAELGKGSHQRPAYILECKKASPSKGLIRAEFKPAEIAKVYKHYASVISVLTDEKYFQGDFTYINLVRNLVSQPVLCKDFMIDEYQVYLARYHHADAILLMLSVLDDATYRKLAALAHQLGMGVLTETSNEEEFERALALKAKVIGINNRNLHDLSVDLNRIKNLVSKYAVRIPPDVRLISESGIYDHRQIREIKPFAHAFLIGSSLMGSEDLNNAVRAVIFGENKVCGLTRPQDVQAVYDYGALYGGLIFAPKSPRCVSLQQAQELVTITTAPLRFVGVFQNQSIDFIVNIANQLNLYAVQLHGAETPDFVTALRTALPPQIQIWQAISIDVKASCLTLEDNPLIARYILDSKTDSQQGGTGKSFDWSVIPAQLKHKIILAGGINPVNVQQALQQDCIGIDANSGLETSAGIKSKEKIAALFEIIQQN
ncbi:bifunctional indole-3-glycerol-phosphate synthase TrpC/phosphoribosylanthranilate isomerase TrpF [Pasteurellaceae bacterium LIM206]|nr:bifunctional indole-3-glycerol-phosphate synthase TrpC/phosphoribosylanthranilate isomerase TrpF [Pasteurellaceae bacterium LIM206]